MPRPVILDMDPGVDDALALCMACASGDLEVLGVTTVSGNVHVDKATENALRVLEYVGSGVRVYKGLAKPLVRGFVDSGGFHGGDGLGDSGLPPPSRGHEPVHAVRFIIDSVASSRRGEVVLVATGPLTNVAVALLAEPEVARRLGGLVVMGGAYGLTELGRGNVTSLSEFNFYVDPEAARVVLESGVNPVLVGLDVTASPGASMGPGLARRLLGSGSRGGRLAYLVTKKIIERDGLIHLHDPMALAYVLRPGLFVTREYRVGVVLCEGEARGQSFVDRGPGARPNARVAVRADERGFLSLFYDLLTSL